MHPYLVAILVILGAVVAAGAAACLGVAFSHSRLARHRRQARRWREFLEEPVRLPDPSTGYDDAWTDYPDATDVVLAALHNQLWPREEYQAVLNCAHPALPSYTTREAAEKDLDHARRSSIRACACGGYHIHYRTRRAIRPRAHH